jgi:hypothetical protein
MFAEVSIVRQVHARADSLISKSGDKLSKEQAVAKVLELNPEFFKAYRTVQQLKAMAAKPRIMNND